MKKIKNLFILCLTAAFALFAAFSCETAGAGSAHLIPSDAILVANIKVANIMKDANLSAEKIAQLTGKSEHEALIESIDTEQPLYLFVGATGEFGCVGTLADKSSFGKLIADLDAEETKKIGNFQVTLAESGSVMLANNGKYFIMSIKSSLHNDDVINAMLQAEKEYKNFKLEDISKITKSVSDITLAQNNDFSVKNAGLDYNIGVTFMDINFENGKIISNVEIVGADKRFLEMSSKPTGKYNDYLSSNSVLYMLSPAMKGDDIKTLMSIDYSKLFPTNVPQEAMSQIEAMMNVLKEYLGVINGEITLGVDASLSQMALFVDVKGTEILNYINRDLKMVANPTEIEKNQYQLSLGMVRLYYGVYDNTFYVTMSPQTKAALKDKTAINPNFNTSPFATKIKGSYGGFEFNVSKLMSNPILAMAMGSIGNVPVLSSIDRIEAINTSQSEGVIEIIMKDSSRNALEIIVNDLMNN